MVGYGTERNLPRHNVKKKSLGEHNAGTNN